MATRYHTCERWVYNKSTHKESRCGEPAIGRVVPGTPGQLDYAWAWNTCQAHWDIVSRNAGFRAMLLDFDGDKDVTVQ